MRPRARINSFLGSVAGRILCLFGKSNTAPTPDDLKKARFKTSTQDMGVRYTERIRDVFRFRWLKKLR